MIGLGIVRKDLAALFWGASFLLFVLYTLLGNHLDRLFALRKLTSEAVDLKLPAKGVFPGDKAEAYMRVSLPALKIPGFSHRFLAVLRWKQRKPLVLQKKITGGENSGPIQFTPGQRGTYHVGAASLVTEDFFGFTHVSLPFSIDESLRVYPGLMPAEEIMLRMEGGDAKEQLDKRQEKADLLEVRKYFPGDDVRKLNWKIFAHIGELFIRRGEDAPPPASNLLFIFDSGESPLLPPAVSSAYLDMLVELACSVILLFLMQQSSVMFSTQGMQRPVSLGKEKRDELLSLMTPIWWTNNGDKPAIPESKDLYVILFSTPGSPSLGPLIQTLKKHGWQITLIYKALDFLESSHNGRARFALKQLFFVDDTPGPDGEQHTGTAGQNLRRLREMVLKEVDIYRKPPWKLNDVRAI